MSTFGRRLPSVSSTCLFHFPKLRLTPNLLRRPFSSSASALSTSAVNEGDVGNTNFAQTTLSERLRSLPGSTAEKDWDPFPKVPDLLTLTSGGLIATSPLQKGESLPLEPLSEEAKKKLRRQQKRRENRQLRKQEFKALKAKELLEKAKEQRQMMAEQEIEWQAEKEMELQAAKEMELQVELGGLKAKKLAEKAERAKEWRAKQQEDLQARKEMFLEKRSLERQNRKAVAKKNKWTRRENPPHPSDMEPDSYLQLSQVAEGIEAKKQESAWTVDTLQPGSATTLSEGASFAASNTEGQLPSEPLRYSRRIEGLIEPTTALTLEDVAPPSKHNPIATLSHGLDRVLFNPGVHWLQDPRSKVYNFPPHLEVIPKVTDFAFERLGAFIKSSRDNDLWELARREKRTFAGSTSSLSGMLSHIYFLISGDKDVNTKNLSRHFKSESQGFTAGQRMPASVILNHKDGIYAIDSDAEKDKMADKNILTWMGTLLEKFLTSTPEEFAPYMRFNTGPPAVKNPLRDAYRYAKSEKFVMRSQLDCVDPRLPGTGVFDIKTRACLPIRMDLLNFEENSGYLIRSATGMIESFEREYYDLIRSAFLKYSFQVRIGNMDGVIVAYHNTARMFGFQYIPLEDMDEALFGPGAGVGDQVFNKCVALLEKVVEEAAACFPGESVKCTFEKREGQSVMNVWVQPADRHEPEGMEGEGGVEGTTEGVGEETTPKENVYPPIKQLEVKVSNFLGQVPVRGSQAVGSVDEPWTSHWSISKLASSGAEIHAGLAGAKQRQFRYIDIPTGWDEETVGKMWNALNFGGVEREEGAEEPLPDNFRVVSPRTQELRHLARVGGEETAKRLVEEEGQAKVWIGGTVEWEELQEIQDLLRRKEPPVSVIEEVTDEVVAAEQERPGLEEVTDEVVAQPGIEEAVAAEQEVVAQPGIEEAVAAEQEVVADRGAGQ